MFTAIKHVLESRPLNFEGAVFEDIVEKNNIESFIGKVIIPQIYDESLKEFSALVDGYHYFRYFNYFAGMRLTHNRAILIDNNSGQKENEIPTMRKGNFRGKPIVEMDDIYTGEFGRDSLGYSEEGGFKGKGGFIHFFDSNLSFEEADLQYNNILDDGLYSEDLISIVTELMFYNENYQIGITMSYEFLINNAGRIQMYTNSNAFYLSRYSTYFRQFSAILQYLLIAIDILYLIGLLYFSFEIIVVLKRVLKELYKFREINIFWFEIVDLAIVILSYVSLGFWVKIMINPPTIKMPVEESSFQEYIDFSS